MMKENPTKRPKVPPNSATRDVRGQTRTSFFKTREDWENFSENDVEFSEAPTGVYGSENSVYLHGGRQPVVLMMFSMFKSLEVYVIIQLYKLFREVFTCNYSTYIQHNQN